MMTSRVIRCILVFQTVAILLALCCLPFVFMDEKLIDSQQQQTLQTRLGVAKTKNTCFAPDSFPTPLIQHALCVENGHVLLFDPSDSIDIPDFTPSLPRDEALGASGESVMVHRGKLQYREYVGELRYMTYQKVRRKWPPHDENWPSTSPLRVVTEPSHFIHFLYEQNPFHFINDHFIPLYKQVSTVRCQNRTSITNLPSPRRLLAADYHTDFKTDRYIKQSDSNGRFYSTNLGLLELLQALQFDTTNIVSLKEYGNGLTCFETAVIGKEAVYLYATANVSPELKQDLQDSTSIILNHLKLTSICQRPRVKRKITVIHRPHNRRILNEEALLNRLRADSIIHSNNMEEVEVTVADFGSLPLREQILTACETDVLIGVHGAAMTWGIFMNKGAVAVEIVPYLVDKFYSKILETAGMRYYSWTNKNISKAKFDWKAHDKIVGRTTTKQERESILKRPFTQKDEQLWYNFWQIQDTEVDVEAVAKIVENALKDIDH
eukprot:GILJ01014938.1.p1 GENE.GILJ01014938.1~~GILJ01014938.1.p1  ORF type:complete len:493 (+),score=82.77 GILJ01014938.1:168-1646(+)